MTGRSDRCTACQEKTPDLIGGLCDRCAEEKRAGHADDERGTRLSAAFDHIFTWQPSRPGKIITTLLVLLVLLAFCGRHKATVDLNSVPDSGITFEDIREAMKGLTDAQWDVYTKSLEGKKVTWRGWVSNVKQTWGMEHEVHIDMDEPGSLSVPEVSFVVPESQAMGLVKDQPVCFTGVIKLVMNVLGACSISLEPAELRPC